MCVIDIVVNRRLNQHGWSEDNLKLHENAMGVNDAADTKWLISFDKIVIIF